MIFTLASSPSLSVPLRTRILSKNDRVKSLVKPLDGVANAAPGNSAWPLGRKPDPSARRKNHFRALALVWSPPGPSALESWIFICMLLMCFKRLLSRTVPPVRQAHRQTHSRAGERSGKLQSTAAVEIRQRTVQCRALPLLRLRARIADAHLPMGWSALWTILRTAQTAHPLEAIRGTGSTRGRKSRRI